MKKRIIKKASKTIMIIGVLVILIGCHQVEEGNQQPSSQPVFVATMNEGKSKTSNKNPESLDKGIQEIYAKKAEDDINLLDKGKLVELNKKFSDAMKSKANEDGLDKIATMIQKAGNFEKVEKMTVKEIDGEYITETTVKYSESEMVFSISYNSQNKISTLSVK